MNTPADTTSSSVVNLVNDQVDKKIQSTFDVGAKALQSPEVQQMIKTYGLEDYVKNVKQENVKNLLAVVGTYFMFSKFKKRWPYVLGGLAALYAYSKSTSVSSPAPQIAQTEPVVEQGPTSELSGYNNSMY